MSEKKLAGKVAVITGGARGLGRGYALHLAGLGADVAIIDRNLKGAEVYGFEKELMTADSVMAECEALGVKAMGIEADLTDRQTTEQSVNDIHTTMGCIDIVVCNAGGGTVVFAEERNSVGEKTGEPGEDGTGDLSTTGTPSN